MIRRNTDRRYSSFTIHYKKPIRWCFNKSHALYEQLFRFSWRREHPGETFFFSRVLFLALKGADQLICQIRMRSEGLRQAESRTAVALDYLSLFCVGKLSRGRRVTKRVVSLSLWGSHDVKSAKRETDRTAQINPL
jgi:hypothetical protein